MHRAEDRLQIYLQKLLSSIILGNDTDSALVDDFPNLVHEVCCCCVLQHGSAIGLVVCRASTTGSCSDLL